MERLHLRRAAREAGVGVLSMSYYLGKYADAGVLGREKRGNLLEFWLNEDNPYSIQLKKAYALHLAAACRLVEKILRAAPHAAPIALYGSYASGGYDEKSDYDVLAILPAEERLPRLRLKNGKPVSLLGVSLEKWRKLGAGFRSSVVKNHVVLYGAGLVEK